MNTKIKNALGIASIILALALALSAGWFVAAYHSSTSADNTFTVSAESKVVTKPDVAQVTASVITEGGKNLGDLQNQNSAAGNKLIAFLKGQGVDPVDIETSNYSITPRYESCSAFSGVCPPPSIVGYTISQDVTIKIRDFSKISAILSGAVQNGANSLSQLSFSLDDPTSAKDKARAEAITKAETEAQKIANEAGFRLGNLVSVSAEESNPPVPFGLGAGAVKMSAAPVIEPGSQTITVTAVLKYEIE